MPNGAKELGVTGLQVATQRFMHAAGDAIEHLDQFAARCNRSGGGRGNVERQARLATWLRERTLGVIPCPSVSGGGGGETDFSTHQFRRKYEK
jgi:hypothetical protein